MKICEWLEARGIHCKDSRLIEQAFVHSSYVNEHKQLKHDNERLEFMGDAVLQLWVSDKLFRLDPPPVSYTHLCQNLWRQHGIAALSGKERNSSDCPQRG